jgi:hypothetical protein
MAVLFKYLINNAFQLVSHVLQISKQAPLTKSALKGADQLQGATNRYHGLRYHFYGQNPLSLSIHAYLDLIGDPVFQLCI